jgi:23S rRNA G2445 N2-methylase RlmL
MVGNLRAAALTGAAHDHSIVIAQQDVRGLTPDDIERLLPAVRHMQPGVFCFNPPYGVRIGGEHGEEELLALYADMGRALGRFSGWRAACFVANPKFVYAFGHRATMTKPASNANLRGTFLVFQL